VVHTWSMNLLALLSETSAPGEVIIDDTWYSPGVVGFVATFSMGGAAVLIVYDLVRRVRRVRYRAEIAEKLDLEQLEQSLKDGPDQPRAKPERPAPPEKPQR
jgi:hypothetical protein